jgi:hypothetical protein
MRLVLVLALATFGLAASAVEAAEARSNPLSLEVVGTCSDGSAYDAFSPARGAIWSARRPEGSAIAIMAPRSGPPGS